MMGFAHALSGVAVWLTAAPALAAVSSTPMTLSQYAAGAVIFGGAAVAPDLDHPKASATNSLPPVSNLLGSVVATVGFGHRKATHSLVGIFAATVVGLLLINFLDPVGPAILAFFLTAFAIKALGQFKRTYSGVSTPKVFKPGKVATPLIALGVAVFVGSLGGDYTWMVVAFVGGVFVHIVGDAITMSGVPWLWPLSRNFRLAALRAGGSTEKFVIVPMLAILIGFTAFSLFTSGEVFGNPVPQASGVTTETGNNNVKGKIV